ncbi:ATP-binding protein [Algibacillus agarilyticus]|uniref:ATP-binding protein n=1 Tax=Algibacillus agarilyticus TaxID=2234133 RepID=UPI000DD0BE2C|nr:ATP-binding protein [Algibacillus agarilyticus]
MKLKTKILLFVVLILFFPLAILGLYAYQQTKTHADTQAEIYQQYELDQKTVSIKHYFDSHLAALQLLAKSEIVNQYIQIENPTDRYSIALNSLLKAFSNFAHAYSDFYEIRIITIEGEEDARFNPRFLDNINENEVNTNWFKVMSTSDHNQALIFDENRDNDETALYAIHKLFKPLPSGLQLNQAVWGFLVITIEPNLISKVMIESEADSGISLLLTPNQQAFFNNQEQLESKTIPHYMYEKLLEAANKDTDFSLNYKNEDMIFKANNLDFGYYLAVGTSVDKLYSNTRKLSLFTIFLTLIMIITACIISYYMITRTLLNPLERLIRVSKKVANGQLAVRINIKREDEIGQLFESFNKMTASLESSRYSIKEYQTELEQRVNSRTLALQSANEELIQSRQEAEQANELKSRFLANMSHEIRTPLTAILGFTEHALSRGTEDLENRSLLQRVEKNGRHLLALINDILDLAKIESGKLQVENIPTSIFDIMADIETSCADKAHDKDLDFKINYTYPIPETFNIDPTRLKQILLNICSNAIKFTKKGSVTVNINYYPSVNNLIVEIIDTGIGMSAEEVKNLFNPFIQADISTTRNFGGTGLGLAITKYLAEILNCEIFVQSEKLKGSRFTLKIKALNNVNNLVDEKPFTTKANNAAKKELLNLKNKSILLAEDNPDNQTLLKLLIEPLQAELEVVENGLLAVEHAIAEEYDLILMDMQMPLMGGLEATSMLRQAGIDTPIIALTANCMQADLDQHKVAGCTMTLAKPIDNTAFYKMLRDYLANDTEIDLTIDDLDDKLKNSDEYKKLVKQFEGSLTQVYKVMVDNHEQNNLVVVQSEAHKLKGSAASLGFPDLSFIASDIEISAKANDTNEVTVKLNQLQQAMNKAIKDS